jgi:hypothetical protein
MTPADALRRIRACLALSASAEPHEAAAALRQAQLLMQAHGLDAAQVEASVAQASLIGVSGQLPTAYAQQLACLVRDAFGVALVWRHAPRGSGHRVCALELIGVPPAPEIAGHAWEQLWRRLRAARKAHLAGLPRRLKPSTRTRRADLYALAWVEAAWPTCVATVPDAHQRAIAAHLALHHPEIQTRPPAVLKVTRGDAGSIVTGYRDGAGQRIHPGMATPPRASPAATGCASPSTAGISASPPTLAPPPAPTPVRDGRLF